MTPLRMAGSTLSDDMRTILDIRGMHCQACVSRLTNALQSVPGVAKAMVTLSPPRAVVDTSRSVATEALVGAVRAAGDYIAAPAGPDVDPPSTASAPPETTASPPTSLYPLLLIVGYIAGVVAIASYFRGPFSWHAAMTDFMAGFFLVFSFFKLLDLRGFARAYRMYDLPARWIPGWAFAYPFVELALGVAFLVRWNPMVSNAVTLGLMLIGAAGVLKALLDKRTIRCACLGTALNLPMTMVTLVEDLAMAAMAAAMLVWHG